MMIYHLWATLTPSHLYPSVGHFTEYNKCNHTSINKSLWYPRGDNGGSRTYHGRHCEIPLVHFVGEPVHLPAGVAEDHSLSDGESLVQIAQSFQLPVLFLNVHIKLLDT